MSCSCPGQFSAVSNRQDDWPVLIPCETWLVYAWIHNAFFFRKTELSDLILRVWDAREEKKVEWVKEREREKERRRVQREMGGGRIGDWSVQVCRNPIRCSPDNTHLLQRFNRSRMKRSKEGKIKMLSSSFNLGGLCFLGNMGRWCCFYCFHILCSVPCSQGTTFLSRPSPFCALGLSTPIGLSIA